MKLGASGLATATLFGLSGVGTAFAENKQDASGGSSSGASSGASSGGELHSEFEAAAKEYGLPVGILLALGYTNTRWEMPPADSNPYKKGDIHGWGSYGIMALVQNPTSDTLGEAARLTGLSEEKLKTDRASNIRGGAALLAASVGEKKPQEPADYLDAVAGRGRAPARNFTAVSGVGGGELYAEQVREALEKGVRAKTSSGEELTLAAQGGSKGGGR